MELTFEYNGGSLHVSAKLEGKKRTFKIREDRGDCDDQYLIERYRLDRNLIENVCELVRDNLDRPTKRNEAVSVLSQVLVALRFYATGNFFSI